MVRWGNFGEGGRMTRGGEGGGGRDVGERVGGSLGEDFGGVGALGEG